MITIFTTDGRTLSFDEKEEVMIVGTFDGTNLTAKVRPVVDVQPGNWLWLCASHADRSRDYDFVLVANIAGKLVVDPGDYFRRLQASKGKTL